MVICLMFSCGSIPRSLEPMPYLKWFDKNPMSFVSGNDSNDLKGVLNYTPVELEYASQYLSPSSNISELKSSYEKQKKQSAVLFNYSMLFKQGSLFNQKVTKNESSKVLMEYYAFRKKKDIKAVSKSGDTIPCSVFFHEIGISNSPRELFKIEFNNINIGEIKSVIIADDYFIDQKMVFDVSSISKNKLPELKLR